jgi:hypothetical protein
MHNKDFEGLLTIKDFVDLYFLEAVGFYFHTCHQTIVNIKYKAPEIFMSIRGFSYSTTQLPNYPTT